ncbi:MAG: histidine kinase, partial [Pseudomonadota bacterium]|nr:histidine kinase [Pseudomonadota bacterium]
MADYYPLLAKAVAGLPDSTAEARHAIYERARGALFGQLRNLD